MNRVFAGRVLMAGLAWLAVVAMTAPGCAVVRDSGRLGLAPHSEIPPPPREPVDPAVVRTASSEVEAGPLPVPAGTAGALDGPVDDALGEDRSERTTRVTSVFQAIPDVTEPEPESSPAPFRLQPALPAIPPPAGRYPIDLPTALRLAESENPYIGEARARVGEALALLQKARLELVPTLNGGVNYDGHAGPLQRSSGDILPVSRQALYFGGGAQAEAAGPPAVPAVFLLNHLSDGLFDPLAARQRLDQVRFNATATANTTLLEVADYYLELQGASARLEVRRRTEADAAEVARMTAEYARAGQGNEADARRGETEWRLRKARVHEAEEAVAVASARLARRLHLDPSVRLQPVGDALALYPLIELATPVEPLVRTAERRRPEVAAGTAGLAQAETRARQERSRPLLPTIFLGFSGAAFGGGSNIVPPLVGNFRGRTDFDVFAYWSLLNFGLGNAARIRQRDAEVGQAFADRGRALARVRDEVAAARGDALAQSDRIAIARGELENAEVGFREDLERTYEAVQDVRPIELTNSLDQLGKAREQYVEAIIAYNQAQFHLFVALGSPPPLHAPTAPPPTPLMAAAAAPAPLPPPSPAPAPGNEPGPAADVVPVVPTVAASVRNPEPLHPAGPPIPVDILLKATDTAHADALRTARDYEEARSRLRRAIESRAADTEEVRVAIADVEKAHRAALAAEVTYQRTLDQVSEATEHRGEMPKVDTIRRAAVPATEPATGGPR